MPWTTEQVLSLAPDGGSASAGKKLADARHWRGLGLDARAIWGECQGSALYQVRVDRNDLAAKCSCPSRKFPCKHSLALLLLAAQSEAAFAGGSPPPDWVSEWIAKRASAEQSRAEKANQPAKPVDEVAQAKRSERREERVREGLDALALWLGDLVRGGLALVEQEPPHYWEAQAARLVNAQAPALAGRVRALAAIAGTGPNWPSALLGELGKIALLVEAHRNLGALPPPLQSEVRQRLGWTVAQEEVIQAGDLVSDTWFVIGNVVEEDERFRVQRSWLTGKVTGRPAMILQFAAGPASFPELIAPGTVFEAELAFWPGASPSRALIRERRATVAADDSFSPPGHETFESLLEHYSDLLAAQPWLDRTGTWIRAAAVEPGGIFHLVDRTGQALPLSRGDHWKLAALSGGHPIDVAVEWNGHSLLPIGAFAEGCYHRLARA